MIRTLEEVENYDYVSHIEKLIDISNSIELDKVTILTGSNSCGKSLIRKLIQFEGLKVASSSMEARTSQNPEWGALSNAMNDTQWLATSINTIHPLKQLLKLENKFIVIDEPEIGMGEEVILGLVQFINEQIEESKSLGRFKGVLIITHNRLIVEHIKSDVFVNIDGMSKEEWWDREIKPLSIEVLREFGSKLFRAVQDRINENKKRKESGEVTNT